MSDLARLDPPTVCPRCAAPMGEDPDPLRHPDQGARHMYRCLNGHTLMGGFLEETTWACCAGCAVVPVPMRGGVCEFCRRRGTRFAVGSEQALAAAARRRCPRCGEPKMAASATCRACRPRRGFVRMFGRKEKTS